MAINLNIEKYGAQFNAFAEFAAAHKNQDWVVRIEGQGRQPGGQGLLGPNGEPRNIVAKTLDGAGKILRFAGSRAVNNDVRQLFKETVLAVCGVRRMEDLPPSVLAVMKKDDYDGKGHPLTVRRIKAVTNAIKALADEAELTGTSVSQTIEVGEDAPAKAPEDGNKIIENDAGKDGLDDDDVNPADLFANNQDPFQDPDDEVMENGNEIIEENGKAGKIVEEVKPEVNIIKDVKTEAKIVEDIKPEIKPGVGPSLPDTLEKLYGAKQPYFGRFLFNIAKATVDATKEPVGPGELRAITAEEFAELRQKSREVDISYISGIISNTSAKVVDNLVDYRDTAFEKFESLYPAGKDKDTPIMRQIKRNLFVNLALEGVPGANISAAAFVLKTNNNKLVNRHGLGETLNLLHPGFALKARTLDIRKPL